MAWTPGNRVQTAPSPGILTVWCSLATLYNMAPTTVYHDAYPEDDLR
jgi:hypothetical protein